MNPAPFEDCFVSKCTIITIRLNIKIIMNNQDFLVAKSVNL